MRIKKISIAIMSLVACFFTFSGVATAVELATGEAIDYLLPEDNWLHERMDKIFRDQAVLKDEQSFAKAGFKILRTKGSGMMVASHSQLPGYLIKAFLTSNSRAFDDTWMVNRCRGAENVRNVIQEKNLKYIIVPDKWIYYTSKEDYCVGVLVVTHMKTLSHKESAATWKKAPKKVIDELYAIVGEGFASIALTSNVSAVKGGKFACLDTEFPDRREFDYKKLKKRLSPESYEHFCNLLKQDEKN